MRIVYSRCGGTTNLREREPTNETIFNHGQIGISTGKIAARANRPRFAHGNDGTRASSGLESAWEYSGWESHALDRYCGGDRGAPALPSASGDGVGGSPGFLEPRAGGGLDCARSAS